MRDDRLRIARRQINEVQLRIVGDRLPSHAAAVLRHLEARPGFEARIAGLLRHGIPAPLERAGRRIPRFDVARRVEIVAAHADDHVLRKDDRGRRGVVVAIEIADRRSSVQGEKRTGLTMLRPF